MQEPYQLQEAHDLVKDRQADGFPRCNRCGGIIWEEKAVHYNDKWICWECEGDFWNDIRTDFLEETRK